MDFELDGLCRPTFKVGMLADRLPGVKSPANSASALIGPVLDWPDSRAVLVLVSEANQTRTTARMPRLPLVWWSMCARESHPPTSRRARREVQGVERPASRAL